MRLRRRRRPAYYKALAGVVFCLSIADASSSLSAQTIERYEGILIDTSGSIAQGGSNDLFQRYLFSVKKLLQTEPGGSRIWVSTISIDSFGGLGELVQGWTPKLRGAFADDLTWARRQLAARFEAKSSKISISSPGTDLIGGLWHLNALFESSPQRSQSDVTGRFCTKWNGPSTLFVYGVLAGTRAGIQGGRNRPSRYSRFSAHLPQLAGCRRNSNRCSTEADAAQRHQNNDEHLRRRSDR
jgi:hypothetical protein